MFIVGHHYDCRRKLFEQRMGLLFNIFVAVFASIGEFLTSAVSETDEELTEMIKDPSCLGESPFILWFKCDI